MSFQDITIVRHIPIVGDYAQVHDNLEQNRHAVTIDEALAIANTTITRLGPSAGGSTAGSRHGTQMMVTLPARAVSEIDLTYNSIIDLV